ncbi:MAG: glycosyltransferase family 39 protein, partial [Syntrophobacterales bacterium]|nr:glycosyltransferase family 39 protein [Syntrophobacterales bacterium]
MNKHYITPPQSALFAMFYLVIFTGISLAVYQFILNRSLWLDEASLALNIIGKDFLGLTKPLDYKQVAPIGFLFIERLSVLMLGKNEFALRIFPLISFLVSMPFFYLLAYKLAGNKIIALLSTSILSITLPLLRYSSEVKQYSSDVMFAVIILCCSLTLKLNKNRSLFIYAIIGSIAIWFSNISVIILFVAGIYSLYFEGYRNKNYRVLFPILFWAISFFIYYVFFIHNHPHTEFMINYWRKAFLPLNPFSKDLYSFLLLSAQDIYGFLLGFGRFWFIPLLISFGAIGIMLKHQKYTLLYFCLAPI